MICACGRPLLARPGDLTDTCPECRNLPAWCDCPPVTRAVNPDGTSRYEKLRAMLLDSAGLETIGDPVPLIGKFLFRDSLAWLHAKPASGKSLLALDWAGCVANGVPWNGHDTGDGEPVLYLTAEGVTGQRKRVRAWEDRAGETMKVTFLPCAVQLLDVTDLEALIMIARDMQPAMIVIDTQARCSVGAEENSAKDMGLVVRAADRLRTATGACVLLLHHEPRSGENMRGSTSLEGAANTILRLTKDGTRITLSCTKQKDESDDLTVPLKIVPRLGSVTLEPDLSYRPPEAELTDAQRKILSVVTDVPATLDELMARYEERFGKLDRTRVSRHLQALLRTAQVDKMDTGPGRAHLWVKAQVRALAHPHTPPPHT